MGFLLQPTNLYRSGLTAVYSLFLVNVDEWLQSASADNDNDDFDDIPDEQGDLFLSIV